MGRREIGAQEPPDSLQPQGPASAAPLDLAVAKLTDVGRARPHNEDYVDCYVPPDPLQLAHKGAIYLVADGMGGHQAGEVASKKAVESVISTYYGDTGQDIGTSLVRAFRRANREIYEWAQADPSKAGMGTTLVAAVILGRKVYVANVGDSRAYLVNDSGIRQITEDHSWVEEQVRAKLLTPEEAKYHPQRNVVTRALGSKASVEVDVFEGTMGEGDSLVLCSDGLSGPVEDREIASAVNGQVPEEAARSLVARANERGGNDNISIVIVSGQKRAVGGAADDARKEGDPVSGRRLGWAIGGLAGLLLVALLAFGGWYAANRLSAGGDVGTATVQAIAQVPTTEVPVETPEATAALATPELASSAVVAPAAESGTLTQSETVTVTLATATLIPTLAPTTPAPTVPPPTPSPNPPPASTPTPGSSLPTRYPAPTLTSPEKNASLRDRSRFAWEYSGPPLGSNQAFDIRIWSKQHEETLASDQRRGAIAPTTESEAEIGLDGVPAIQEFGAGEYYWSVVVVRLRPCAPACPPTIVGEWGEQREFSYSPPGSQEKKPTPGDYTNPPPPPPPDAGG